MEAVDAQLRAYVEGLKPQRMILRAVNEHRPVRGEGTAVAVKRVAYVEVITVVDGSRTVQRFDGASAVAAAAAAKAAGHDVIEKSGNLT